MKKLPVRLSDLPLLALIFLLLLAACDEMDQQPRYDSYEPSALFANGASLQVPPAGTIARDDLMQFALLATRPAMSAALLQRGRDRYAIYCVPCHDAAGYGNGTVPARGFPHPPSYHSDRLRRAPDSHIVDVISHGYGVMAAYGDRVAPADRWAIAAYIRALQLSQNAPVAALDPTERRRLEETPP